MTLQECIDIIEEFSEPHYLNETQTKKYELESEYQTLINEDKL